MTKVPPLSETETQHEGYGLVLSRAARFITRIYNRHLADVSLTASQYGILTSISSAEPVALRELADILVIERSALLRMVQPLLAAGFLLASADPGNRKRLQYRLADEGRRNLEHASKCVQAAEAEIEQLLGRTQIREIHDKALLIANVPGEETKPIVQVV
jgi:DNA-binding MarR family transcriptional regulator